MTSERLITIMGILQAYAHLYIEKLNTLALFINILDTDENDIRSNPKCDFLIEQLKDMAVLCKHGELPVTETAIECALFSLTGQGDIKNVNDAVKDFLMRIQNRLPDELLTKYLFQLSHARKKFFVSPLDKWEPIVKRFPQIIGDVEEMNKCFALSRYTAAMFHAMQVAELGAIELGHFIEVEDPMKGWGPTQKKLQTLIKAGRNQLPTKLAGKWDFLDQMNREIDSMVLSWRNKIDHAANRLAIVPNSDFTPDIAEHIMGAVRVFMLRLQEGLPK